MNGEEDEEERPASLWLHPLTALLCTYIPHVHLEDPVYVLLLPYYCATCQIHDKYELQRGDVQPRTTHLGAAPRRAKTINLEMR